MILSFFFFFVTFSLYLYVFLLFFLLSFFFFPTFHFHFPLPFHSNPPISLSNPIQSNPQHDRWRAAVGHRLLPDMALESTLGHRVSLDSPLEGQWETPYMPLLQGTCYQVRAVLSVMDPDFYYLHITIFTLQGPLGLSHPCIPSDILTGTPTGTFYGSLPVSPCMSETLSLFPSSPLVCAMQYPSPPTPLLPLHP